MPKCKKTKTTNFWLPPVAKLRPGTLYVCVTPGGVRSSLDLDTFFRGSHWDFVVQRDDILMATGDGQYIENHGALTQVQKFLHLPTNTVRWVHWREKEPLFHQLKGMSDRKDLRGYPKVV